MTWFVVKVARALKHRPQFLLFKLLPLCRHQVRGIDTCHGQQQTQPHHQHSHILAAASTLILPSRQQTHIVMLQMTTVAEVCQQCLLVLLGSSSSLHLLKLNEHEQPLRKIAEVGALVG